MIQTISSRIDPSTSKANAEMQQKQAKLLFIKPRSKEIGNNFGHTAIQSAKNSVHVKTAKFNPLEILPILGTKPQGYKPPVLPKFSLRSDNRDLSSKYSGDLNKIRPKSSRNRIETVETENETMLRDAKKLNLAFSVSKDRESPNKKLIDSSGVVKMQGNNSRGTSNSKGSPKALQLTTFTKILEEKIEERSEPNVMSLPQKGLVFPLSPIVNLSHENNEQGEKPQSDGKIAPVRPIADAKAISCSPEKKRIKRDEIRSCIVKNKEIKNKNVQLQLPLETAIHDKRLKTHGKLTESQESKQLALKEKVAKEVSNLDTRKNFSIDLNRVSPKILTPTSTTISKPLESKRVTTTLTEDEKTTYGDRCPEGYEKIDLLGKGGFALVWLAKKKSTGEKVALKQILNKNKDCMQKEIHFGRLLFAEGGEPQPKLLDYPGIGNVIRFIDFKQTSQDTWLVFELGGSSLTKLLFEIKGEFVKGERIYNVKHLELCKSLREKPACLKAFIRQMAQVLHLLSDLNITHCDLKTENILVASMSELIHEDPQIKLIHEDPQIKLIDFGSAFNILEPGSFGMITPEYMPPEVLGYLSNSPGKGESLESFLKKGKNWSIDVWSLGSILLEIITGVPLWLSLKCRTSTNNVLQGGLFGVKGRDYQKIKLKQKAVFDNFEGTIGKYVSRYENGKELLDLLQGMLQWDPKLRISPLDILNHCYLY